MKEKPLSTLESPLPQGELDYRKDPSGQGKFLIYSLYVSNEVMATNFWVISV